MSMDRKNLLAIISIAVAIVVPLGVALQAKADLANNPVVKIKIAGYDPRDLLYGRYLNFSYEWNWGSTSSQEPQACVGARCCLCVEAREIEPKMKVQQCAAAKTDAQCGHIIRGHAWSNTSFAGPPTQLFVDETKAIALEQYLVQNSARLDFHVGLSLPPSGKARIENFYIEGKPYLQYMQDNPEKFVFEQNPNLQPIPVEPEPEAQPAPAQ